jgi:hypothetical protein
VRLAHRRPASHLDPMRSCAYARRDAYEGSERLLLDAKQPAASLWYGESRRWSRRQLRWRLWGRRGLGGLILRCFGRHSFSLPGDAESPQDDLASDKYATCGQPARKYADLVAVGSQMGCGPKARRAIRLRHVAYVSMVTLCEEGLATEGEDKLMW